MRAWVAKRGLTESITSCNSAVNRRGEGGGADVAFDGDLGGRESPTGISMGVEQTGSGHDGGAFTVEGRTSGQDTLTSGPSISEMGDWLEGYGGRNQTAVEACWAHNL